MKFLVTTTEVYRVGTEAEATALINEAKADAQFALSKSVTEHKERKQKGEVIDEWYKVTLVKKFNEEKEPDTEVTITYEVDY